MIYNAIAGAHEKNFGLDGTIAIRAEDFASLHTDPADRLIAATADCLRAHLMTADAALLAWAGARGIDARV